MGGRRAGDGLETEDLYLQPGLAIWPGVAIALSVMGQNLVGDGLRDLLDPRLRLQRVG